MSENELLALKAYRAAHRQAAYCYRKQKTDENKWWLGHALYAGQVLMDALDTSEPNRTTLVEGSLALSWYNIQHVARLLRKAA